MSESSDVSSYPCESSDSLPEWLQYVDGSGAVFYVDHFGDYEVTHDSLTVAQMENEGDKQKSNNLGLFVRLIRRRNSRRSLPKKVADFKLELPRQLSHHLIAEAQEVGDTYEVPIKLDKRYSGFTQGSFFLRELGLTLKPRKTNLVVHGIIPYSSCSFQSEINVGDCLISINGTKINSQNVYEVLNTLHSTQHILLRFSKPPSNVRRKVESESLVIEDQETAQRKDTVGFGGAAVVYCELEQCDGLTSSSDGIVYSFPSKKNAISPLVGIFLTLNHLLPSISAKHPLRTNLAFRGEEIIVSYVVEESQGVLLVALPLSKVNELEASIFVSHLRNYLLFNFQTLSACFKVHENHKKLDEFFNNFLVSPLDLGKVQEWLSRATNPISLAAHFLPLSHEAYVQLDDALNELESNNMEVYESQRPFSVIGSCYFYKGLLLCSHLAKEDLVEVASLCHHLGLLLESKPPVKQLLFWKEVFPPSVSRGLSSPSNEAYTSQPGRFFLLIVGKGDSFLPVLFQSTFWSSNEELSKHGPNIFYVEEAESTLFHIERIGIPSYVRKWLGLSPSPYPSEGRKMNQLDASPNLSQVYEMPSSSSSVSVEGDVSSSLRGSQGGPVLGRRAERERLVESSGLSKVSGSDFSDDSDWAKDSKSSRRSELMDLGRSPFDPLSPTRLGGSDVVFYIYTGSFCGAFISSHQTHPMRRDLLPHFFSTCHQIHNIFLSAITFKKLKVEEMPAPLMNKSLIAIKEHGLGFFVDIPTDNGKPPSTEHWWVVGRLFSTPSLKEVYVCHLDTCPFNLVEMTFRLTLNTLF